MYVCMTRRENAFPSFPARANDFHVTRFTLHVTKSIVTCKVKKHELRAKQRLKRSRNTTPLLSLHASGGKTLTSTSANQKGICGTGAKGW